MESLRRQAAYVERLHVRGRAADPLHTRLRLDTLMQGADLTPVTLPPASILVVRHLADPLPGRLAPQRRAIRVDAAWEAQVREALADHYRRAARPQRGAVPGAPDAILFADEAEMVACMALALHQRRVDRQWWWRILFRRLGVRPELQALFCDQAATLPAALRHLTAWGQAASVVKTLSPAQTIDVLRAVARAHDLPTGCMPLEGLSGAPGRDDEEISSGQPASQSRPARQTTIPEPPHPPWAAWVPAATVPPNLPREPACLLGAGLLLHVRPSAVHSVDFRIALHRWWQAAGEVSQMHRPLPDQETAAIHGPRALRSDPASPFVAGQPDAITPAAPHSAGTSAPAPDVTNAAGAVEAGAVETDAVETDTVHPDPMPAVAAADGAVALIDPEMAAAWAAGVVTQVGGVFYLVNLMRVLKLPACFEESWGLASQVGPWGVLELLGRALLGGADATVAADPLWRAMAELDNRPHDTLPGGGFHAAGSATLPPEWGPPPVPDQTWTCDTSPLLYGLVPDLGRWLALVMPSIRSRLQRALRLDSADEDALAQTLILVPGRLYVTPSHVDLVMRLDAISLPVRRAGLDANPGWLPHFGRVVTFHFQ